ncbi:hypothetical protein EJ07DRAFT_154139 [Lizonia empirigonia]|nr:hypothetical protein EJ07DRAFT_154139 [Lizonia empirigonia]
MVYDKLPREIRDMVYGYLCLEDRRIPIGPYYHYRPYQPLKQDDDETAEKPKIEPYSEDWYVAKLLFSHKDFQTVQPDGRIRTDHRVYPQDNFVMPENHIFHPSYMGKEVVLEMLELYYKRNSFSVCNVEGGLGNLCTPVALGSEDFGIDFVPIDHISDLQIRVKCEHFTPINTRRFIVYHGLNVFAEDEPLLRNTVESLAAFRSRVQISHVRSLNIEIVLMSDLRRDAEWFRDVNMGYRITNMLQTVRNAVYELIHDCRHTTVRVTHQDETLTAFPKDYTGLFQLSKEQWEYEKSKYQPGVDWSQDFWIVPINGDELSEGDRNKLGGYYDNALKLFLAERWGITDVRRETTSKSPPVEGFAWPVGCPYYPDAAKGLVNKLEAAEDIVRF